MKMDIIRATKENFQESLSQIDRVGLNVLEQNLEDKKFISGRNEKFEREDEFTLDFEIDEEDDDD